MKPTVLTSLLLVLLCVPALAQVMRVNSLPAAGVVLEKGWRWQAGDKPEWAAATFDDSRWDTISGYPTRNQLPGYTTTNIGWARLRFQLDSAVAHQPLSMRVLERWAADLYVDSRLIYRFGRIGERGELLAMHLSPRSEYVSLPQLAAGEHMVALRLARQSIPWYVPDRLDRYGAAFGVRLVASNGLTWRVAERTHWNTITDYWLLGFFLALATINVFYYIYRRQRISLIFTASNLFGALSLIVSDLPNYTSNSLLAEWGSALSAVLLALFLTSLLYTYYLHLRQCPHWLFWLTSAGMLLCVFCSLYTAIDVTDYAFSIGITILLSLGMTLSIRAVKRKNADGWVVLGSMIALIVVLTTQLLINLFVGYSDSLAVVNQVIESLFNLTFPLTLALLLARENAQTNRQLAYNLAEVKQLSADKEQILTQQKLMLEQQVAERTQALQQSLDELRTTQQQLIQREKMASLGELTAGIAHEIQNPLNFVNNFTEVSSELVEELRSEHARPVTERDESLQDELLTDLAQNMTKIGHHGNRAASIVRGMLEHSRSGTGERQPTDINALADEYLKLSYHGLRAKDKTMNATLVTHFDPTLSPVSVVGQDMGRVLLNLFNNAFYAVQERARQALPDYLPTVTVSTKKVNERVLICVQDNGTGIPEALREKIFQPFFTTKPTGSGTGLGLSLSYDIITKGHAGTLRVESEAGVGTSFLIDIPG